MNGPLVASAVLMLVWPAYVALAWLGMFAAQGLFAFVDAYDGRAAFGAALILAVVGVPTLLLGLGVL